MHTFRCTKCKFKAYDVRQVMSHERYNSGHSVVFVHPSVYERVTKAFNKYMAGTYHA